MEHFPIISTAREELAEVVSSGPISPPSPIACLPWVAMSLMQKAIRRGREDLALRAAAALLKDCPSVCGGGVASSRSRISASPISRLWGRSLRRSAARRSGRNSATSGRSPARSCQRWRGRRNAAPPTTCS